MFRSITSLFGRRLALSSTGGIVQAITAAGKPSTDFVQSAQMWGRGLYQEVTAAGAVIRNSGLTLITTGTTNGSSMFIEQPVVGIKKDIAFSSSASSMTLSATGTTILFKTTNSVTAAVGTTTLTIASTAVGGLLSLVGLSTTVWAITGKTMPVSS